MPASAVIGALHFEAMGTTCSLVGIDITSASLQEAELWVRTQAEHFTRFSTRSELSLVNASAGRWVEVSSDTEDLLRQSLHAHDLSHGLVNIAVLPAMIAIGYTRPLAEGPTTGSAGVCCPAPPVSDVLTVRPGRVRLEPGCGLDLGGVAKGWMADRLVERLGGNVVANIGGDLRAAGPGPKGDGWPVGFGGVTVMLRDQGAATSSVRRRKWGDLHHLIDPRTGLPASTGLSEVSVVARTGLEAEVVAKTVLLLGPETGVAFCAAHAQAWWLDP